MNAWAGPISDSSTAAGVDWILAENWMPYQADNFVTPGFAAFTSGHSTFSRAAAEVLAAITGDEFFPGGLGQFTSPAQVSLGFENGPSQDITLQWATYYDAGLSRLYGGIHVQADDLTGRVTGATVGMNAYALASSYFAGIPEPTSLNLSVLAISGLLILRKRN